MKYTEFLYDEKNDSQFSVELLTPEEIWDSKPKSPDGDLPWRDYVNYRLFIALVARLGKERKIAVFPLSGHRPIPDQRSRLHQEARRAGVQIKTYRWGDDLLVWRRDFPIKFQKPVAQQDFYARRQLRKLSGLSQLEAARRAGLNYSTLCRFELGYERISDVKLKKLDEVLRKAVGSIPDVGHLVSTLN